MSSRVRRAADAWTQVCLAVVFPAIVAHEATHAVAGRLLGATHIEYRWRPQPHVLMDVPRDLADWRIRLMCLAPTVVGVLAVGASLVAFGPPPAQLETLLFGAFVVIYAAPSDDDLRPFRSEP